MLIQLLSSLITVSTFSAAERAFAKLFLKEKPYIVHANTPKSSLLAMVAGFFAGVPNRLYTVTGLRYQGATGTMRMLLKTMERLTCLFATKLIPEGIGVQSTLTNDRITSKQLRVIANGNINGIDTDKSNGNYIGVDYVFF